ncbi:SDR family NAD(P)-dependent oxidoreductase [Pyxidicoccus fallax]|uniref:SDR family NAD(P)-dependent oxidoreductase n=1 Tax=Pyxidicoccus fallax TaxID=394095 RepID=A0A848LFH6_9BACT|nr:oxidoreductase [Pyxidicoccus fallax]NMO15685.1 SDR family NAD(P)-dependent oxidoreductase [Pyxidicoccus fallax]NPC77092.1 SDR family NAD(P)-dependent oxidoreductase [Pyxidicoccus fallax]
MKTWFITGISRGLGLALARAALSRGDTVIGTVRGGAPKLPAGPGRLHVLELELSDARAVEATVAKAFELAGRIDVIVNNAGYGLLGTVEQATDAEVERLFTVDVFGPFRVIRAALPRLRAQRSGHIVNITSIAGRAPGTGSALYAAAKFALEGLSASLAQEVASLGIRVTAVAPGAFRTDFLSAHSIRKSEAPGSDYAATVGRTTKAFDDMAGKQLGDPEKGAAAILAAVDAEHPPLHLLLGSDALRRAREKLDVVIEEMNAWEAVTRGTDFTS